MDEEMRDAIAVIMTANVASEAVARFVRQVNASTLLADAHGISIQAHAVYALLAQTAEDIAELFGADFVEIDIDEAELQARRIRLHAEQN